MVSFFPNLHSLELNTEEEESYFSDWVSALSDPGNDRIKELRFGGYRSSFFVLPVDVRHFQHLVQLSIEGPSGWVLNGCGVETSNEEIGEGRRRVVWKTEHPVRFFNVVGGPLKAAPGRRSTVYFDPRTEHNAEN
jgi:hypothetical protein